MKKSWRYISVAYPTIQSDQDRLTDNYYRTPEDRAARARQRLAENNIQERVYDLEEFLRMEAQKSVWVYQ